LFAPRHVGFSCSDSGKNERANISATELDVLKEIAADLLGLSPAKLAVLLADGALIEVDRG
jgi:hypothetical protein